jgi:hypothetical protein
MEWPLSTTKRNQCILSRGHASQSLSREYDEAGLFPPPSSANQFPLERTVLQIIRETIVGCDDNVEGANKVR